MSYSDEQEHFPNKRTTAVSPYTAIKWCNFRQVTTTKICDTPCIALRERTGNLSFRYMHIHDVDSEMAVKRHD
jgi:hypothetical protein